MNKFTVELEDEVINACEQRIQGTMFKSVEEYIAFIVTEAASIDESEINETRDVGGSEDQLRALGYID